MATAFATVLRRHRRQQAVSQEALAERADLHPTYVSLIERFERNPSLNVARSLADALGIPLSALVQEAEELQREADGR